MAVDDAPPPSKPPHADVSHVSPRCVAFFLHRRGREKGGERGAIITGALPANGTIFPTIVREMRAIDSQEEQHVDQPG